MKSKRSKMFSLLSDNAIIIANEILDDKEIIKLLSYNSSTPLSEEDILDPKGLFQSNVFITPFTGDVPAEQKSTLHINFDGGDIQKREWLKNSVDFEILVHRDLWLIKDEKDKMSIRPYLLMDKIFDLFDDKSIGTLGVLKFVNYNFYRVDNMWGVYKLRAKMSNI